MSQNATGHILIVDDNPYSDEMLEELLRQQGYTVQKALTGQEARAEVSAVAPDLVLMDTRLPDRDAFKLQQEFNSLDFMRDVPIIFMSAHDDTEMKILGSKHGDDHLTKPFDAREVLARVERQVTVSRVRTALRESEAKFQSVMESAIDAIISADAEGIIRAWNRAATALFSYTAAEALGQPLELIIPRQYHDAHRTGVRRVTTGGKSHVIGKTVELSAIRKGGVEFPIELSLATWFLDDDRYYTGIIRDISERKQAEQKFRSVTESAIDAIISADHEGVIVSWNSAASAILGFSADEVIGQRLELIIPERFHDAHREGMARVTSGGESRVIGTTVELFARTKDGGEIPIELSLSTWTVHDDRYYTGIIRDITERKQAELQLREYAEELSRQHEELKLAQAQIVDSEKQAMLGRLLAGLLHEVNTPLGALRSSAGSLTQALKSCRTLVESPNFADNSERIGSTLGIGEELSDVIIQGTLRIESVIDGLNHLIAVDGATQKVHDLREGIETALMLLRPHISGEVTTELKLADEPIMVFSEPARLNQVFLNIIQNAITAVADEGTITIVAAIDGDAATVSVQDTGKGMTPEQIQSAFDFTFTEREGRIRLQLGLATSKKIIQEAGGDLSITSAIGEGTTVNITLPRAGTQTSD